MSVENSVNFELVTPAGGEHSYLSEGTIINPRTRRELGRLVRFGEYEILQPASSPFGDYARAQLESSVVGQPDAIEAIIDVIDRAEVRLDSDKRPMAVLALLGPSGVGKTETATALSRILTGEEDVLKIDCSQYSQGHEVMTLIGSPPSYVGRQQKPIFSPDVVESSDGKVILFDEIEKGSQALHDIMLQITDKGSMRLNNGQMVSFRDTVIVMTSNLGAREMADQASSNRIGFGDKPAVTDTAILDKTANSAFDEYFRPEFVGRINKKVVFKPLGENELHNIIDIRLRQTNQEYRQRFGVGLSLTEGCRNHLVAQAMTQSHLGARPLIDQLDQSIYSELGRHISLETVGNGMEVKVFHRDELPGSCHDSASNSLIFTSRPNIFYKKPPQARISPIALNELSNTQNHAVAFVPPSV